MFSEGSLTHTSIPSLKSHTKFCFYVLENKAYQILNGVKKNEINQITINFVVYGAFLLF